FIYHFPHFQHKLSKPIVPSDWLLRLPLPKPPPRIPSMERQSASTAKRILKRKLEQEFVEEDGRDEKILKVPVTESDDAVVQEQDTSSEVEAQVRLLNSSFYSSRADRESAKSAAQYIAQLAKDEDFVDMIVDCGAIPALVKNLQTPPYANCDDELDLIQLEVEKACAFALALIGIQSQHQQVIVDAGALPHLVSLLKRHKTHGNFRLAFVVVRKAADAITNLSHENNSIKTLVRFAYLLCFKEWLKVAFHLLLSCLILLSQKCRDQLLEPCELWLLKMNRTKIRHIVELNALNTLVLMLQSDDPSIHFEAVGVIGNLVHSSPHIKQMVLLAGALQPVICLLRSTCTESQREAALLLGQFSTIDSDCKVHIGQRGAIPPLIEMLESSDVQLKEMSAFALGRLAQETHNQAGIVHHGGIEPLLQLLRSNNGSLQHNAAFTIFGLAENEDNTADLIKVGAVQKLQDGDYKYQPTKECVEKTLKRIEENIRGRVLKRLVYLMRSADKTEQRHIALALAHLCAPNDRKAIFLDSNGLDSLLELLELGNLKQRNESAEALYKLATKAATVFPITAAPLSPTPQVYLGEQYVNNSTLSDVTFLIEGKRFYAHRICLLASSDTFRAMFDGGYKVNLTVPFAFLDITFHRITLFFLLHLILDKLQEREAKDVEIPNIRWEVFELMMRFIYTGSVDIKINVAHELLVAADQYFLDGLKRLCEYTIAQDISVENISRMYELSESFCAMTLREACILFTFQHFDKLSSMPWCSHLIKRILPDIRSYFARALVIANPLQPSM
ncbi:ARM REPEAT PROTEIN INTERACTING WITH ABF2, partial [Linum perenne]